MAQTSSFDKELRRAGLSSAHEEDLTASS